MSLALAVPPDASKPGDRSAPPGSFLLATSPEGISGWQGRIRYQTSKFPLRLHRSEVLHQQKATGDEPCNALCCIQTTFCMNCSIADVVKEQTYHPALSALYL